MARLHSILHEQGRQIDELRLENSGQRKRIESLETCLEEEMARRQGEAPALHWAVYRHNVCLSGEMESISVRIETEVQERIYYDRSGLRLSIWVVTVTYFRRINTVVDHDREANGQALVNLKEHMERENEILRWCLGFLICVCISMLLVFFNMHLKRHFPGDVYQTQCQFTSMPAETRNMTEGERRSSNTTGCS